jgi:hypothetical protein
MFAGTYIGLGSKRGSREPQQFSNCIPHELSQVAFKEDVISIFIHLKEHNGVRRGHVFGESWH